MNVLILADRRLRAGDDGFKKLTQAFIQGIYYVIKSKKGADLVINKIHINPCKGCNSCWQGAKTRCENIGDIDNIIQKFREADLVIWSLPLFYFSSPSIMKAFVGIKALKNPKHVVISIGSFLGHDNEEVDKQFKDMYKENYVIILCSQGELFTIPQMKEKTDKYLLVVKKAGAEFALKGKFSDKIEKLLTLPLFNKEAFLERKQSKS